MIYNIQTGDIPIYKQVVNRMTHQIASGLIPIGDLAPSVRELAEKLTINPMTISKAYGILVERGLLVRTRGGRLSVAGRRLSIDDRIALLAPYVDHMMVVARDLDIPRQCVNDCINSSRRM